MGGADIHQQSLPRVKSSLFESIHIYYSNQCQVTERSKTLRSLNQGTPTLSTQCFCSLFFFFNKEIRVIVTKAVYVP